MNSHPSDRNVVKFDSPLIAVLGLGILFGLAGCDRPPDLGARGLPADAGAGYPALVPLDQLLRDDMGASATRQDAADVAGGLEGRVAALRRRADQLRGPVLDPATQARFQQAGVASALQ